MRSPHAALAGALLLVSLAVLGYTRHHIWPSPGPSTRNDGSVTLALAGDLLLAASAVPHAQDRGFAAATGLVQDADLAIGNLEMSLFESRPTGVASGLWAAGSLADAREIRRAGFDVVSCANNHGADYGVDGLTQTMSVLDAIPLVRAGCGGDLAAARAQVVLDRGGRRIAVIGVTASALPQSRATYTRGEIKGRPGVSALRYSAEVTADASTYRLLQNTVPPRSNAGAGASGLTLFGTRIQKGRHNSVTFVANDEDARAVLDQIRAARAAADIVVLALHTHEPGNSTVAPADFIQRFARSAIDAGADIVVGHGPHQLRAIEAYGRGAILYSLGNFVFHYHQQRLAAVDVYDAGVDLYGLALGAVEAAEEHAVPTFAEDVWWESVIAIATFRERRLVSLRLHPIDLGTDRPDGEKGTPRLASLDRATSILERLGRLSAQFGTPIRDENGVGVVAIGATPEALSAPAGR